jgi:hypothetical protein
VSTRAPREAGGRPLAGAIGDTRTGHPPVQVLRIPSRSAMRTVTGQSPFQIQAVPILVSATALVRFLASLMSARRAAVTSSEEAVMGKWTQNKQHDRYDNRDHREKDRKHEGRNKHHD